MGEEIAFENGRLSDFHGLVTLTLDRVILHTIMHHSSTSTYIPNFIEIEETFCGRTDVQTDGTLLGWLGGVDLKMCEHIRRAGTTVEVKDDTWSVMTVESWSRSPPCHKAAQNGMQVIQAQPSQCAPSWTPATDQSQGSLLCRHWSASVTRTNQKACLMTNTITWTNTIIQTVSYISHILNSHAEKIRLRKLPRLEPVSLVIRKVDEDAVDG